MNRKNTYSMLVAALLMLAPCLKAQLPCLPVAGFNNGGFEIFTTSPGNCTFNSSGLMPAPFNEGCVSGWFASNGTPNLHTGINGGLTPVAPPPGSTVFAGMVTSLIGGICENETITANVNFDPSCVYELTFKHRRAVSDGSTAPPDDITGQVLIGSGLTNRPASVFGTEPCRPLDTKTKVIFSASGISTTAWVTTTTITFVPAAGHTQITFAPINPTTANRRTLWLVDDIVLRKCQPCKAKFVTLPCISDALCAYSFLNQSLPGSGAALSEYQWTITALDDPEQPVITSNDKNFIFTPGCNGKYRICLRIKDSKGCTSEYCEVIDVTCTTCKCQPGPNPCISFPPIDSVRRVATAPQLAGLPVKGYFKVYPNPAQSSFRLDFKSTGSQLPGTLELFGPGGEPVVTKRLIFDPGQVNSINVNGLASGIYMLRVMQDNKIIYTEKIVVTGR